MNSGTAPVTTFHLAPYTLRCSRLCMMSSFSLPQGLLTIFQNFGCVTTQFSCPSIGFCFAIPIQLQKLLFNFTGIEIDLGLGFSGVLKVNNPRIYFYNGSVCQNMENEMTPFNSDIKFRINFSDVLLCNISSNST